jgi:chemotaxis response regulator CheB
VISATIHLIVDGHEPIRKLVRAFLESDCGFSVCGEAVDGYDAIDKAQELKPDLIILDFAHATYNLPSGRAGQS